MLELRGMETMKRGRFPFKNERELNLSYKYIHRIYITIYVRTSYLITVDDYVGALHYLIRLLTLQRVLQNNLKLLVNVVDVCIIERSAVL